MFEAVIKIPAPLFPRARPIALVSVPIRLPTTMFSSAEAVKAGAAADGLPAPDNEAMISTPAVVLKPIVLAEPLA